MHHKTRTKGRTKNKTFEWPRGASGLKRHYMRNPGTDGNLNIININKFHIILDMTGISHSDPWMSP